MRPYVVFILLVGMVGGWAAHLLVRPLVPADGASAARTSAETASPSHATASAPQDGTDLVPRPVAAMEEAEQAPAPPPAEPSLSRPLQVVATRWDLATPGIWANQGLEPRPESPFAPALEVNLSVREDPNEVARRLALGGDQPDGADVAIMALPTLVLLYETLAPLAPQIFLTTGWSQGHYGLFSHDGGALTRGAPPAGLSLTAQPGSPEHLVALYVCQLLGIPAAAIELSRRDGPDEAPTTPPEEANQGEPGTEGDQAKATNLPQAVAAALSPQRVGGSDERGPPIASTADIPRLIPFVAITGQGFLEDHHEALLHFAQTWLAQGQIVSRQRPQAARLAASQPEGPDTLVLLGELRYVGPSSPGDNARASGLSGRDIATLQRLFGLAWTLWQGAGQLTFPAPSAPVAHLFLTELTRPERAGAPQRAAPRIHVDHLERWTATNLTPERLRTRLAIALPPVAQEDRLVDEAALLGRLFEGSVVAINPRDEGLRWQQAWAAAQARYDFPSLHIVETGGPNDPIVRIMTTR